jgi:ABC-type multidrug transport system ATPase subunit
MIDRPQLLAGIRAALRRSRVVGLVGPRQSGKTTMARLLVDRIHPANRISRLI